VMAAGAVSQSSSMSTQQPHNSQSSSDAGMSATPPASVSIPGVVAPSVGVFAAAQQIVALQPRLPAPLSAPAPSAVPGVLVPLFPSGAGGGYGAASPLAHSASHSRVTSGGTLATTSGSGGLTVLVRAPLPQPAQQAPYVAAMSALPAAAAAATAAFPAATAPTAAAITSEQSAAAAEMATATRSCASGARETAPLMRSTTGGRAGGGATGPHVVVNSPSASSANAALPGSAANAAPAANGTSSGSRPESRGSRPGTRSSAAGGAGGAKGIRAAGAGGQVARQTSAAAAQAPIVTVVEEPSAGALPHDVSVVSGSIVSNSVVAPSPALPPPSPPRHRATPSPAPHMPRRYGGADDEAAAAATGGDAAAAASHRRRLHVEAEFRAAARSAVVDSTAAAASRVAAPRTRAW
jgi:hypothetical protein